MGNFKFLIALFASTALSCPPPFNNFKFLTNDTAATVQEYLNSNPDLSWSEAVTKAGNAHTAWPANDDGYSVVHYCYHQLYDWNKAHDLIEAAWKTWSDQLGPAGKQSGHRIVFQEVEYNKGPGTYPFCGNADDTPEDALHIHYGNVGDLGDDGVSYATLGYIPKWWNEDTDRHTLHLADGANVPNIAHEIGHVLGLLHEHQRPDRDHYVKFTCSNLEKYEAFKQAVEKTKAHTIEQVCASSELSNMYGWTQAAQYSTDVYYEEGGPEGEKGPFTPTYSKDYDYKSIMQYKSLTFSGGKDYSDGVGAMPLVRWTKGAPDYQPPQGTPKLPDAVFIVYPQDEKPSPGDITGVKSIYGWTKN